MINELALNTGADIPFIPAAISTHVPRLKEIALIGEESFFIGYEFLKISKNKLTVTQGDNSALKDKSDFDILMILLSGKQKNFQKERTCALMVLSLLFPDYQIKIKTTEILLYKDEPKESHSLNNRNYPQFKEVLTTLVPLDNQQMEYNPSGDLAKQIAEKLKQAAQKKAQLAPVQQKVSIFERYLSILAVGECKDKNELANYTPYQIIDEYKRFMLKQNYDITFKKKMLGAKGTKDAEDWQKDLNEPDEESQSMQLVYT